MDNLTKMAIYAREHGMTYGQLQAAIYTGQISRAAVLSKRGKKTPAPLPPDGQLQIVKGKITYKGETHSVREWSQIMGIRVNTIRERIKRGVPADYVFYKGRIPYESL